MKLLAKCCVFLALVIFLTSCGNSTSENDSLQQNDNFCDVDTCQNQCNDCNNNDRNDPTHDNDLDNKYSDNENDAQIYEIEDIIPSTASIWRNSNTHVFYVNRIWQVTSENENSFARVYALYSVSLSNPNDVTMLFPYSEYRLYIFTSFIDRNALFISRSFPSPNTRHSFLYRTEYQMNFETFEIVEIDFVEAPVSPKPLATVLSQPTSTSTWARNDTHFFFLNDFTEKIGEYQWITYQTLHRVPLSNIEDGELILSNTANNKRIVGISEQYLFFSTSTWTEGISYITVYQMCLDTLQIIEFYSGRYADSPRLHWASNSMLFSRFNLEIEQLQLLALCLDTMESRVIYTFIGEFFWMVLDWQEAEDDKMLFFRGAGESSHFTLICPDLQVQSLEWDELEGMPTRRNSQPRNPGEEFVWGLSWSNHFVTIDNWLYYVWDGVNTNNRHGGNQNLYRIRLDGTDNQLVKENADFYSLFYAKGTLFGLRDMGEVDDDFGVNFSDVFAISTTGEVITKIGSWRQGHNSGFGLSHIPETNFVLVAQHTFGALHYWAQGIYCLTTGQFFSVADLG